MNHTGNIRKLFIFDKSKISKSLHVEIQTAKVRQRLFNKGPLMPQELQQALDVCAQLTQNSYLPVFRHKQPQN